MTDQHPITPPPELVREWAQMQPAEQVVADHWQHLCTQAARWGADAELEACVEWLQDPDLNVDTYKLRAARRPKPPSLKEQALKALEHLSGWDGDADTIRRALELVPEGPAVTHSIGCEHIGGAIHAGTVTTHTVTKAPEPAAAPDRPLWKLMQIEHESSALIEEGYANALRVVADWLERRWPQGPDMHPCVCAAWLRAEAERAEAP